MPFEIQVKIFFYFLEKLCFILEIFIFLIFNHPIIYQVCDVMMSISTWDRVNVWIYLLNLNCFLSDQTRPIDRHKQGQQFSRIFWIIWKTGAKFQVLFNLATCSNYSMTNYVKIIVPHLFEKLKEGQLKMVNVNY